MGKMGKMWSFVLALADLGVLAVFFMGRGQDMLRDASLLLIFAVLAVLAWGVALATALHRIFTRGHGWLWALVLVIFCWIPALPALLFGVSGVFSLFGRRTHPATAVTVPASPASSVSPARRARWSLPPVDRRVAASRSIRA
ncbi:MAG TPA: hypothetical protein VKT52_10745 [Ktedonobacterales bacterium]|nr:hypothetical protein [Ktedonobacterales bacterium]